jgi:SAM-dependent methyltransferase
MATALTDQSYWDSVWSFTDEHLKDAPSIGADLHQMELMRRFCAYLGTGRRFLEVGAGGSAWPAHVAARLGAEAWGIDFSAGGLSIAAACAARDGVRVRLVEGDFFDAGKLPSGTFDVVYSGGFVEHFPDAAPLMRRMAELLSPGGVVITAVPNLDGVNGVLQKLVDADCYARHIVFTPDSLDDAHALGGLHPVEPAHFFGVMDLGSVNFSKRAAQLPTTALKLLWAALSQSRKAGEKLAGTLGKSDGGRFLAPGILGIYTRP